MSGNQHPYTSMSASEIDIFAWSAANDWPRQVGIEVVHEGIDYGDLTRWYLWGKIGRAIRKKIDPKKFRLEETTVRHRNRHEVNVATETAGSSLPSFQDRLFSLKKWIEASRCNGAISAGIRRHVKTNGARAVYVPYHSKRLERDVANLVKAGTNVLINGECRFEGYRGAYVAAVPRETRKSDVALGRYLFEGILKGLQAQGIELLPYDAAFLSEQLMNEMAHIRLVEAQLKAYSPDAVFLHGDNHAPYQTYASVAKREGIPTVTFQHGLDCEHYYLDDIYASTSAVWSTNRLNRYRQRSKYQPAVISVTGNPEYDDVRLKTEIGHHGSSWLWISRPHTSHYCYNPSRCPMEGIEILETVLEALVKSPSSHLTIKPHPSDLFDIYREIIERSEAAARVSITLKDLNLLLDEATVVISEDSTGGMEAMFSGKIIVHAHLAPTPPVLPMVEYGAALPGYSIVELKNSLERASSLTGAELSRMAEGQRAFIDEFAGPLDGRSGARRTEFLLDVVNS